MLSFTAKNDITLSTKGLDLGCPLGVPKASLRMPEATRFKGEEVSNTFGTVTDSHSEVLRLIKSSNESAGR